MLYLQRTLEKLLSDTVNTRPIVYLNGPRQVGKSTLAEKTVYGKDINLISFDSPLILSGAQSDPAGFIKNLPENKLNIIDEAQLLPEIFRQLKVSVDNNRKHDNNAGLYLLTGSANILALPKLSKALAGRMSVLTLLPFSSSEYHKTGKNFIESLWSENLDYRAYDNNADVVEIISYSTYPEIALNKQINRTLWFNDYVNTIIQRDIQTLEDIRNPGNIVQMLVSFSQRAGSLLNNASVMKETGLDAKTYAKYKGLINNTFLTFEVEPWAKPNKLNKRFVKQNKIYFTDTNLLCYIMRRDLRDIYTNNPNIMGYIFENFIAAEIKKAAGSLPDVYVSQFNLSDGKEVDFAVENTRGEVIGIEVKLAGSLSENDFSNLKIMRNIIGDKFKKGIVIYTGKDLVPFGDFWAVPVNYLWEI